MNQPSVFQRIHSVDALRGFALAGIVLVHMVEQFLADMPTEEFTSAVVQGPIDMVVEGFVFLIFRGKFFALFSLLFGLSFFIQMDRAAKKGTKYKMRFFWRLIILFIIGFVHHLFYSGDILTIYAWLGVLLIMFYDLSDKVLLISSLLLFIGAGRYIVFAFFGGENVIPISNEDAFRETYIAALTNGSLMDVWSINIPKFAAKWNFQIGVFGRAYLTFAFFLIGLWLGRKLLLESSDANKTSLKRYLKWSSLSLIIIFPLFVFLFSRPNVNEFQSWISMFALTSYDLANLAITIIIATGFILLFYKKNFQRKLKIFAPYGKMALSNYFFQTIIGTYILYNWGLGYFGHLRNFQTFSIAIIIIVFQMIYSYYWLKVFHYGPLEWVWRSLTYFKIQPFLKKKEMASDPV